MNRIQKALKENSPYELLISDLSFDDDHTPQKIVRGTELIKAVRAIQPDLKVLIFSIENRAKVVHSLFKNLDIHAYVPKARQDAKDLKIAIETLSKGKKYVSPNLKRTSGDQSYHDFSTLDKSIIAALISGKLQKEIPKYLEQLNIRPSGLSSVEKRLKLMRENLDFSTNEQLIAYCIETGIV
ncbi:hypothetical protein D9M68_577820 [compost metagenome]